MLQPTSGEQGTDRKGNNNNNNNNTLPNKRNYPFEERGGSDRKIAKICENSFRPLIQKVFPDSEIRKISVRHGALPGDYFTSAIYAIQARLKSSQRYSPALEDKDDSSSSSSHSSNNSGSDDGMQTLYLLMKCFPSHPARQDFFQKIGIFMTELDMYRLVLPELIQFQMERLAENDSPRVTSSMLLEAFPRFYGGEYRDDYHRKLLCNYQNCTLIV